MNENRKLVVVVDEDNSEVFEGKCAELLDAGYCMSSSSCGFIPSGEYDFQSVWQAVFIYKEEQKSDV